ncbi:hypothetical protein OIU84_008213 [Salix udensis]|uniref:Uncharacterized protein n=1 Tax=Salix udensis TaxID=889485 RepID=A0AAD6JUJ7_9ROSI|nr:hypothetical protein OIU84_008213 [Salix udensis]
MGNNGKGNRGSCNMEREYVEEKMIPETSSAAAEPSLSNPQKYRPDVPGISDHRTGHLSSGAKKSELKIGESSAFFTYIKSGMVKNNSQGVALIDDNTNQNLRMEEKLQVSGQQLVNDTHLQENGKTLDYYSQGDDFRSSTSVPDSLSVWKDLAPLQCQVNFPKEISRKMGSICIK